MLFPRAACLAFGAVALAPADVTAEVILVPDDHPTIQAAIDVAVDGDEIIVAAGVYDHSRVDLLGKAITLRSEDGPKATIIDTLGSDPGSIVTCVSGEGPGTLVAGFTISGGFDASEGGGMRIVGASPTIVDCIFALNIATHGGAIFASKASPTITDCVFVDNTALEVGAGAIAAEDGSKVTCSRSVFRRNDNLGFTLDAGAISISGGSDVTLTDCAFDEHLAASAGVIVQDGDGTMTVNGCTFSLNAGSVIEATGGSVNLSDTMFIANGRWSLRLTDVTADISGCTFTDTVSFATISIGTSAMNIMDCVFQGVGATGEFGGAISSWTSQVSLLRCKFSGYAGKSGGALFSSDSVVTATQCAFIDNVARLGGAIYSGLGELNLTQCGFRGNAVGGGLCCPSGGAIYAWQTEADVDRCSFDENFIMEDEVGFGGALSIVGGAWTVSASRFADNEAVEGAVDVRDRATTSFDGCVFEHNRGVAIYGHDGSVSSFTDCVFQHNQGAVGGAIRNDANTISIIRCQFAENNAVYGGAIHSKRNVIEIIDSAFVRNRAAGDYFAYGGALFNGDNEITVRSSVFIENSAVADAGYGGAMSTHRTAGLLQGCLFRGNVASTAGGAQYTSRSSPVVEIADTIYCGNHPDHLDGPWLDGGGNRFEDLCATPCLADVDSSGTVDATDLLLVLARWGPCDAGTPCPADLDGTGDVGIGDLHTVLALWGACPRAPG